MSCRRQFAVLKHRRQISGKHVPKYRPTGITPQTFASSRCQLSTSGRRGPGLLRLRCRREANDRREDKAMLSKGAMQDRLSVTSTTTRRETTNAPSSTTTTAAAKQETAKTDTRTRILTLEGGSTLGNPPGSGGAERHQLSVQDVAGVRCVRLS